MDEYKLNKRLENFEARRDKLNEELEKKFDADKHRQLNIIEHHITVCSQRLFGFWEADGSYTVDSDKL
jgi:hypothetical protein